MLSGKEAYSIDSKIDDGSPVWTGQMRAFGGTAPGDCSTTGCIDSGQYDLTETTKGCRVQFRLTK